MNTDEPKEYPAMTVRCTFGGMRPPFLNIRFYNIGGSAPSMAGGLNLLDGKKVGSDSEFICGHTRILEIYLILHPHRMFNYHRPQFSSDSTLGNTHGRMNQYGAVHLYNRLDSTFGDAFLVISTISTKADVLVLFN